MTLTLTNIIITLRFGLTSSTIPAMYPLDIGDELLEGSPHILSSHSPWKHCQQGHLNYKPEVQLPITGKPEETIPTTSRQAAAERAARAHKTQPPFGHRVCSLAAWAWSDYPQPRPQTVSFWNLYPRTPHHPNTTTCSELEGLRAYGLFKGKTRFNL